MDDRLRVTLVAGSMPEMTCGTAEYTARLCEALVEAGVAVRVVTSEHPAVRPGHGYQIVGVSDSWGIRQIPRILRLVLDGGPAVVHLQYPTNGFRHGLAPGLLLPLLRVLAPRTKLVATVHEYEHLHPMHRLYVAATMPLAHAIITPDRAQIASLPFVRDRMVSEIALASNLRASAELNLAEPPSLSRDDELVVGTWGLLREDKGIDLVIDAFEKVAAQRTARLVIAGDPGPDDEYISRIEGRIAASPVADRINRTGRLSEAQLVATLSTFDACVLPYRAGLEANRGTYATAVASGVHVVTTSLTRSGFDPARNTTFVPPDDVPALVEAMLAAQLHPRMARRNVGVAWMDIAARHIAVYRADQATT